MGAIQTQSASVTELGSKSKRSSIGLLIRLAIYVLIAVVVLAVFYVPRQLKQHRAVIALKEAHGDLRTQPIAVPFVADIFGPSYAEEIVEVYLVGPDHGDEDLALVKGLGSLQKLELSGSAITSGGLVNLVGLSNLYTLHLANTQVDDSGLKYLAKLKNLGILSLDNTKISDAGISELEEVSRLERLSLDGTDVTDTGMQSLAKLVNLKELTLTKTQITDAGAVHLKSLKKLEILKLFETQVSLAMMNELSEALPNCTVWVPTE